MFFHYFSISGWLESYSKRFETLPRLSAYHRDGREEIKAAMQ